MRTSITYPTDHVSCTQDELLYTASLGYRAILIETIERRGCARIGRGVVPVAINLGRLISMQHIQLYLLIISRLSLDRLYQAIRQSCLGLS